MANKIKCHEPLNQDGFILFDKLNKPTFRLAAVGDIAFHDVVLDGTGSDKYSEVFSGVLDQMEGADIKFGNLETVISKKPEVRYPGKACRVTDLRAIDALKVLGMDVLSFANNHVKDMGDEGLIETVNHIRHAGIKIVGAGNNITEARKPIILEKNGVEILFFAYSYSAGQIAKGSKPGCAEINLKTILEDLAQYDCDSKIAVVSLHMDAEFQKTPSPSKIKLCRTLADNGVDVILCHHPHVPQGIERWNKSLIVHSLGNFVGEITRYMSQNSSDCNKSFFIDICFSSKGVASAKIVPVLINSQGRPYIPDGEDFHKVLKMVENRSSILLNEEAISENYRNMVKYWFIGNVKLVYWSLRKLDFKLILNVFRDISKTKMKMRWVFDFFLKRYCFFFLLFTNFVGSQ